jgi:hypothetical protein
MTEIYLQQKFKEMDHDNDGLISVQDLKKILHEMVKEDNLQFRIEDLHPNLKQLINFEYFQEYMYGKLSKESTIYYHEHGSVGRRSTSITAIEVSDDDIALRLEDTKTRDQISFARALDILVKLSSPQEHLSFAEFLQRHHPNENAFNTLNIRI